MVNITVQKDPAAREVTVTFRISERELQNVELDDLEMQLLAMQDDQPADVLLKLETIARRLWEQRHPSGQ